MVRDFMVPPGPLASVEKLIVETIELLACLEAMAFKCETCDGTGLDPRNSQEDACRDCGGVGEIISSAASELGDIRSILKRWTCGRKIS